MSRSEPPQNFTGEEGFSNFSNMNNVKNTNNYTNNFINLRKENKRDPQSLESPLFNEKIKNILDESKATHYSNNSSINSHNTDSSSFANNNLNISSNYFYYKLFDSFGEGLDNSTMVYKNMFKVKLFKEENHEGETMSFPKMKKNSEKDVLKKREDQGEDCFGPQKNKKAPKERQFKPY
jgi:hypothetical protein